MFIMPLLSHPGVLICAYSLGINRFVELALSAARIRLSCDLLHSSEVMDMVDMMVCTPFSSRRWESDSTSL